LNGRVTVKYGIQIECEILSCHGFVSPRPEFCVFSVTHIKEQGEGSEMAIAPDREFPCVLQRDLHLEVELFALNGMLCGVVEPDLQDLPVELLTSCIRFRGIPGT